jgi:hypothetical protein
MSKGKLHILKFSLTWKINAVAGLLWEICRRQIV